MSLDREPKFTSQRWDLMPFSALINLLFYLGLARQITDLTVSNSKGLFL